MNGGLELCGVHLRRGARPVLRGVNAVAQPGAVTVVLGANGAGKSTLLMALAGLLAPSEGQVLLHGTPTSTLQRSAWARAVASLGQDEHPDEDLSALEVALLGRVPLLGSWGLPGKEDVAHAMAALEALDAAPLASRPLRQLSGGERQRALLARVLCQGSDVLLLDEPTHALDMGHARMAMKQLSARAQAGGTVVVALHDVALAGLSADQAWVLHQGEMVAHGPVRQVLTPQCLEMLYGVPMALEWRDTGCALVLG